MRATSTWARSTCCPGSRRQLADLFAEARHEGGTTSLDTQGDWEGRWQGGLREALRETDLYFANRDEALAVAASLGGEPVEEQPVGEADLERVLEALAALGPRPVVKCGAQGALALDGGAVVRAAALRAAPVDTIGAGDSFDAGFIYGHLQGWPLDRGLAFAAACGSLSTRAPGGVDAQPRVDEALAAMAAAGAHGASF